VQILYLALSLFLLWSLGAGMWRVLRGPGLFETQAVALQDVAACALLYRRHRQTPSDPFELHRR